MQSFEIPILFIIFNRPDTTQIVFDEIRKIKPLNLYVTADGPRDNKPGEKELCEKSRQIISTIDWPCEVHTHYSDKNLGCNKAVHGGISWFFENVEAGIILEDDCVPNQSFFNFCQKLLETYKDDERIMMISGDNFEFGKKARNESYYFSKFNLLWGWATWKRAWQHNDGKMSGFEEFKKNNLIKNVWHSKKAQNGWMRTLSRMYAGKLDTWDYPWTFTIWSQSGLCIVPTKNLVSNIGFRPDATHTKSINKKVNILANIPSESIGEIKHPQFILQDYEADMLTYKKIFFRNLFQKIATFLSLNSKKHTILCCALV